MDPVLLARIQFAMTIGFHYIFPPLSIGLAWLLVVVERNAWKTGDPDWEKAGRFFGKILALTFAIGVATGIVMEFQFGTNWSEYSKFVGDIFGAPLAAEGIFAFFLESTFLGLYLFGRGRVSPGVHWFAILMVAVGATISAFWILLANSWQQTPTGYEIITDTLGNQRAVLTDFAAAVFNPSMWIRFFHTVVSCLAAGAFLMAGISAYLILKKRQVATMSKSLSVSVWVGAIASVLLLFPTGHDHAKQVAETQPEKFAAIEGIYDETHKEDAVVFGIPDDSDWANPKLDYEVRLPGFLDLMLAGISDENRAEIKSIKEFRQEPQKYPTPPLALTFLSFHAMVMLGMAFIGLMGLALLLLLMRKLTTQRWLLRLLVIAIPFPIIATQLGWVTAEVGRQPWIVWHELKTENAVSVTVGAGEVLFSIILFGLIYLLLGSLYLYLMFKKVKAGPQELGAAPNDMAQEEVA